jgi:hypothetical protein
MEDRRFPENIFTCQQDGKTQRANILFRRIEQTKHGLSMMKKKKNMMTTVTFDRYGNLNCDHPGAPPMKM